MKSQRAPSSMSSATVTLTTLSTLVFLSVFPPAAQAQTVLNQILSRVNDIQGRVRVIESDARDSITAIRSGVTLISGEMRTAITESIGEAQQEFAELSAERADFLANAGQFRDDFSEVLLALERSVDEISLITGMRYSLEFDRERSLIQSLPDRAVAPLYRAVAAGGRVDFAALRTGLNDVHGALVIARGVITQGCETTVQERAEVEQAAQIILKGSLVLRALGEGLEAAGASGVSSKPIQVHGYVGLEIMNNRKKKFGIITGAVAKILGEVNQFAINKLRFCVLEDGQDRVLDELRGLNDALSQLTNLDLSAVSTLARQASVDNLQAAVDGLGTGVTALTTSVSSRASQASIDALAAAVQDLGGLEGPTGGALKELASQHSLLLRVKVEEQLGNNGRALSLFYLPASSGGLLELVREIAEDTIVQHQTLGGSVERAWQWLRAGDGSLAGSHFLRSYQDYRQAYRAAMVGDGGFTTKPDGR